MAEKSMVAIVTTTAMYVLFQYCRRNGCTVSASMYGWMVGFCGHSVGGNAKISPMGLNEDVIIHHVGKTKGMARSDIPT
jgi:hypothetical protein